MTLLPGCHSVMQYQRKSLKEVLNQSDIVTLHVPETVQTKEPGQQNQYKIF